MNVHKILLSFGLFCGMQIGLFAASEEIEGMPQEIIDSVQKNFFDDVYNNQYERVSTYWINDITPEILNRSDENGYTVIHIATELGYYEMVMLFLGIEGIDLLVKTKNGQTAYDIAIEKGHFSIGKELLNRDATQSLMLFENAEDVQETCEKMHEKLNNLDSFDKLESLLDDIAPLHKSEEVEIAEDAISYVDVDQVEDQALLSFEPFFQEQKGNEVMSEPAPFEAGVFALVEANEQNEEIQNGDATVLEVPLSPVTDLSVTDLPTLGAKTWSEACCIS